MFYQMHLTPFWMRRMQMNSNIIKQLEKLNVSKLKLKNGNTVQKELEHHAAILCDCIQYELDKVYDSREPKVYRRTYDLYDSIYIGDTTIKVSSSGCTMSVKIEFDDKGALHTGFMGEEAFMPTLLNEGYQTHGRFADVEYLGWRSPTHFLEAGIERYKRSVDRPFTVKLTIDDDIRMY